MKQKTTKMQVIESVTKNENCKIEIYSFVIFLILFFLNFNLKSDYLKNKSIFQMELF